MKTIFLTRALLILRKSLLSDHLKPAGGNVLIALDNAETPEHINEEPVHIPQTAVAAPEVLMPDNFDADLDSPFDPVPVDLEKEPDLYPPDPHDKWATIKGEVRWVGDADVLCAFPVVYVPDQNPQWEGVLYALIKDIRRTVHGGCLQSLLSLAMSWTDEWKNLMPQLYELTVNEQNEIEEKKNK
ncbi:hypothetical protein AAES_89958 [Amazona aestiva]|uniref:Uncharacterized protein n=1 Tax=Amazona aestiva TaxID=12930 RepID=A0A0Q3R5U3_AMAAE|nr:hypothetical protein AAES_89958 [Amazona aestiva]